MNFSTLRKSPEATIGVIVLGLFLLMVLGSEFTLDINNLDSLQTSIAPAAIISIGMLLLFVTGSFDLSVGSVMGFAGIASALCLSHGYSWEVAVLAGLSIGLLVGSFNGYMVAYLKMNPLIVTLGSMYMVRGLLEFSIGGGRPAPWMNITGSDVDSGFLLLGSTKLFGLYLMVWIVLILVFGFAILLKRNSLGRKLYFIGNNEEAASQVGIHVQRVRMFSFIACSLLASLAGVLATARVGTASRYLGSGIEMEIIIACLIGGASIAGGKGGVLGVILGVVFMSLINNAFNLFDFASEWQGVVVGAVLVTVLVMDAWVSAKRSKLASV